MLNNIDIRKGSNKTSGFISWLYFFIKPYKTFFIILTVNRLIRSGLAVVTPIFIKLIVDYIESGEFKIDPYFVLFLLGGFALIKLVYFGQLYFTYRLESRFSNKIAGEITLYSVNHILSLPTKWHESRGSGSKLARIFEARNGFKNLMSDYFWEHLQSIGIILAILITVGLNAGFKILFLFLIFAALFLIIAKITNKNLYKANTNINIYSENNLGKIYDLTSLFSTVKNLNIKKNILKQAQTIENKLLNKYDERARVSNNRILYSDNFTGLFMYLVISLLAFYELVNGNITTGTFVFILMIINNFWGELENISDNYMSYIENKNSFVRLTKDLDEKKENFDKTPYSKFNNNWKKIIFQNLNFSYNENKKILNDINLEINKGEKIAFVGPSGCGKTTILKLLLKQYQSNKETIFFDTSDIRNIKKSNLLNNIAVVSQDSELFNISIKDNILIKSNTPEKFEEYINKADCKDFINKLYNKENSIVGERGFMLSGGEKQRINIARALASETDIIFLDEATSALDTISEHKIQKVINKSFEDKTLIIIAHRLSTIKNVDKIYVLEDGAIKEKGSFNYLVNKGGLFTKLWKKQLEEK